MQVLLHSVHRDFHLLDRLRNYLGDCIHSPSAESSCCCNTSNGTSLEYSALTYSSTNSLLRLPNTDMNLSQLGMTRSVSVLYTNVPLSWLYMDSMSELLGEGSCVVSSPSNSTKLPRDSTKSSAAEHACVSHILLPSVGDSPSWFVFASSGSCGFRHSNVNGLREGSMPTPAPTCTPGFAILQTLLQLEPTEQLELLPFHSTSYLWKLLRTGFVFSAFQSRCTNLLCQNRLGTEPRL